MSERQPQESKATTDDLLSYHARVVKTAASMKYGPDPRFTVEHRDRDEASWSANFTDEAQMASEAGKVGGRRAINEQAEKEE